MNGRSEDEEALKKRSEEERADIVEVYDGIESLLEIIIYRNSSFQIIFRMTF